MGKVAVETGISVAAGAFEQARVGTPNWGGINLGRGYTMFSAEDLLYNEALSPKNEAAISVMIAAGVHADKETGVVAASVSRIAILAGLGLDRARSGLRDLTQIGLCSSSEEGHHRFKLPGTLLAEDDFPVYQSLVVRGVWAVLPFSGKKLLLYLLAKSRPFLPSHTYVGGRKAYDTFAARSRQEDGLRMVLPRHLLLPEVEETLMLCPESRRSAMRYLHSLGLVDKDEKRDVLVLKNVPPIVYPRVMTALEHARDGKGEAAGGTIRSIRNLGKRGNLVTPAGLD